MSENYGDCRRCRGAGRIVIGQDFDGSKVYRPCPTCDGTGASGNAMDYMAQQTEQENQMEQQQNRELRESK